MESGINNLQSSINIINGSIGDKLYEILDTICDIDKNIFIKEPLKYLIKEDDINIMIAIANSILLFCFVYYSMSRIISMYNGYKVTNIYTFILKIIIITIIVNNSYYICNEIITINFNITKSIEIYGKNVTGKEIEFSTVKEMLEDITDIANGDNGIESIIKAMISYASIKVMFNFVIRYVIIIFLILVLPIAISTSAMDISKGIFKSYCKAFLVNIIMQNIAKIILIIPLACKTLDSVMYKVIFLGSMYIIFNLQGICNELFGRVSEIEKEKM